MLSMQIGFEPHQLAAQALFDPTLHKELMLLLSKQTQDKRKLYDGCFGVRPTSNTAWHGGWDPNSRVLVSLVICIGLASNQWPKEIAREVLAKALYAIRAEIDQNRIPLTYTNVAISLAASSIYLGIHCNDEYLLKYGKNLVEEITKDRIARGGFHEFGSPTYLGLSLLSASFIENVTFEKYEIVKLIFADLVDNWDNKLLDFVGPTMRSYGPSVHTHYSLSLLALNPANLMKSYNPPYHLKDKSLKGIFDLVKPYTPENLEKKNRNTVNILGVANLSLNSPSQSVVLGAANFTPGSWHHQAVSGSIHVKGGALILRNPSMRTILDKDALKWDISGEGETGFPQWLWGTLPPPNSAFCPNRNEVELEGWNISLIDSTHLKVGSEIFFASKPVIKVRDKYIINGSEGSLTLL